MGASVYKVNSTGAAAIANSATVPAGRHYRLVSVTCHFDVAPAAAGSLTVTLNANAGAGYDTLLLTTSMVGVTNLLYQPERDLIVEGGTSIDVAYANADGRTYGCQITCEAR
jgi:hypothetical protein